MELKITGLEVLEKALVEIDNAVVTKYARNAAKKALKPVQQSMQSNVNVDEGELKKHIVIKVSRDRGRSASEGRLFLARVGYIYNKRKAKRWMGAFSQEFGTKFIAAEPFVRPAFVSKAQSTLDEFSKEIGKKIETHNKKIKAAE
jgi:HK97 gp10 family phage protein